MSVILAKVLQDYTPNNETELALRKGQVIVIKEQGTKGQWRGLYKKEDGTFAKGKFPSSFVSVLDDEELKKRKIKVVKSSSGGDLPTSEGAKTSASPRAASAPRTSSESNIPASTGSSSSSAKKKSSSSSSSSISSSSVSSSSSSSQKISSHKLFGVPLSSLVDSSRPVPSIISHSIDYLTVNGLNVPNLFRGTADKKKIQELKEAFEKSLTTGKLPDLSNYELGVITSTFKLFLFYLPGHLLAADNGYNDLTQAARLEDQNEIISTISKIIHNFPPENRRLIKFLFCFLYLLSTHSNENKLTRPILASVFGPLLLPPREDSDSSVVAKVIRVMISMHGKNPYVSPRTTTTTTTSSSSSSSSSLSPSSLSAPAPPSTPLNTKERRRRREEISSPLSPAHPSSSSSSSSFSHSPSPSPSSSSSSVAGLQSELRVKDSRIRDCESTIASLRDSAKEQEKKMKELERLVSNLKDQVKDKDREVSQFEAKHKREKDKESDQAKEQVRVLNNKLTAIEQDVQKAQNAKAQAQKETAEAREQVARLQAQMKGHETDMAKLRAESKEGDKSRVSSLEKAMADLQKEHVALQTAYKEEQALRKKYWNQMEDMKGKIRVYCRTRPATKTENHTVVEAPDMYSCVLKHPKSGEHSFLFDCVYGPESTQEVVFDDVKNLVQSAIDGYNVCIFAYGQTGSGKTHTMVGDGGNKPGIVPRALSHLFDLLTKLSKTTRGYTSSVSCYMLELYNEQLLDMLSDDKERADIKIKKDPNGVVYAHNAHTVKLHNAVEADRLLQRGFNARKTETTNMNERSSRSHLIITLLVESKDPGTQATTNGKISFIDLAGSERVSKSGVSNERLKEAQAINLSLSALGDVISALSRNESFIPYRNHKLTLLMSDSLGGNAKTLMIACVSPAASNVEESFSSLAFATRAKTITNNPVKTVESQEVSRLKKVINDLKRGEKGGLSEELAVLSPSEDAKDKDAEIQRLKRIVHELRAARTPRGTPRTPRESTTPRETAEVPVSPKSPQPVPDFTVTEPKASQPNGVHKSPSNQAIAPSTAATLSPTPPSEAPSNKSPRTPSIVIPATNGTLSARASGATSPGSLPYTPATGTTASPVQFPSRPPPQPPSSTSTTPTPSPARPTAKASPSPAKAAAATPLTPQTPPRTPSPPGNAKSPLNKVPSLSLGDLTSKTPTASPAPSTTSTTPKDKDTATTPKSNSTPVTPTSTSKPTKSPRGKSPRDATGKSPRKTPREKATTPVTSPIPETAPAATPVTPKTPSSSLSVPLTPTVTPASPHNVESPKPKPNISSIAAAAAAAASKRQGISSPRIDADLKSSSSKGELGVVLPNKPGDKLTHPKRPTMAGRRKPTKNALQNKKDMELKSQEAKAAAGGAAKVQRNSTPVGGLNLLAHLVVNKSLNGSPSRASAALSPAPSLSSISDSASSSTSDLIAKGLSGSLTTGSGSSVAAIPSNVDFKQLLDPGGPKLLQIKGRRKVKVRLTELSCKSLNQGDVYILDIGTKLFLWNGSRANRMEKAKGLDVCTRIKDKDRNTRATIITLDENDNNPEFWDPLGGRGQIAEESEGGDDAATDATEEDLLYKIEEQNGAYVPVTIERRRPAKEMLESSHCYVLDSHSEMYIWIGRGCTTGSKNAINGIAKELFFARKDRPSWTRISRITEGVETVLFKEKFSNWPDKLPIATQAAVIKGRVANINKDDKVDVQKMHEYKPPVPRVVEGTEPKLKIWVIADFEKKEIPQDQYGQFYSAESYIILYTYMVRFKECYMIFFWQGRDCSINEKGTSAVLTVDLDEQCGGAAEQIRVVQNQEPLHFLKLFDKLIVHKGRLNPVPQQTTLYHVKATHAIQVVARTTSLNSNDSFLLRTPSHLYVWHGKGVSQATKTMAQNIAQHPFMKAEGRKSTELTEDSEVGGFWTSFPEGDPTQFVKFNWDSTHPPRLFHCTNASGRFAPREVFNLSQDDLVRDDMMILDLYRTVYLWEGRGANEEEKRLGMELAVEYTRNAPDKRPADAPVYHVKSGREPRLFVSAFHGWDSTATILDINESTHIPLVEDMLRQYSRSYTLEELLTKPKELDQTNLEYYLTDQDFLRHFTMSKEEYRVMPVWKREIQKKKVGLY